MSTMSLRNDTPFPVRVEFLSDWSCGTGTGRHGAIDRQVERDADGFPQLPGKTLVAMLRDAAENVAAGFDGDTGGVWHDWVEAVFGTERRLGERGLSLRREPGEAAARRQSASSNGTDARPYPAALRARPLRLAEPVRAAIAAMPEPSRRLARDATVLLRPGVAIDERTGAAADQLLRIEERASAGLTVEASWRFWFPSLASGEPVPWEAELLLRAAARLVDAVGGRRRRGAGRCRVSIGDHDPLTELLQRVDAARPPRRVLADPTAAAAQAVDLSVAPAGESTTPPLRHRYDLRITALTPLLAHRGEVGNTVLTHSYVPGSSLLPLVSTALGPAATKLITGGQVVVTDATPELGGRRAVPTPRALQREKGGPAQLGNGEPARADDEPPPTLLVNLLHPQGTPEARRLVPRGGFCAPADAGVYVGDVATVTRAHAVVDDEPQRPTERSGGLFVYEAMAAGTVLRAEVWLPDGVEFDRDAVTGERALGRSKKDDYGQVSVEVLDPAPPAAPAPLSGDHLVVWLTSDLLLTGEAGEPTTDLSRFAAILGDALGVTLTVPDEDVGEPPVALVTTRRTESWHSGWGLPRPSLVGLAAGSVIRFAMRGQPSPEAYQRVIARGVGERTAEGFGRLRLQPELLAHPTVAEVPVPAPSSPASGEPGAGQPPPLVTDLEVRGWRRELRRLAVARAHDAALRRQLVPATASPAQLGTLRTLAEGLTTDAGLNEACNWLAGVRERRRDAWAGDDDQRLDRLQRLFSPAVDDLLWTLYRIRPPRHVADRVYRMALSALLSEVARAQHRADEGARAQDEERAE